MAAPGPGQYDPGIAGERVRGGSTLANRVSKRSYYTSQALDPLWLVDLAFGILKYRMLDFVCAFQLSSFSKRYNKHANLVFSIWSVIYGTLYFLFNSWRSTA